MKEAIFKRYDINEETYRQRFRTAKVKEGESPSEVVTRLKDMAAKWLKEHDTREKVIDVLVLEQFVTILPEEVRVWVKEHKSESSVIAERLAEDYQQARKTAEEDPIRIKEKYAEGGKRCLICRRIGHIAKDCPNKSYRTNMRTPEGNISTGPRDNSFSTGPRDNSSKQAVLRCYTCDGKGHTSKQCPSGALFCGNSSKEKGGVKNTILRQGLVNGILVDDLLLDTGCSRTIVRRDLVEDEQWLDGESTIIQCTHGDAMAYPLAEVSVEIEGKPVFVKAAVSDTLPQAALVGTDVPGMLKMLQRTESMGQPLEEALMVTTRSCSRKEPEEKHLDAITKEGAPQKEVRGTKGSVDPEDNGVVSHLKEFNFG